MLDLLNMNRRCRDGDGPLSASYQDSRVPRCILLFWYLLDDITLWMLFQFALLRVHSLAVWKALDDSSAAF